MDEVKRKPKPVKATPVVSKPVDADEALPIPELIRKLSAIDPGLGRMMDAYVRQAEERFKLTDYEYQKQAREQEEARYIEELDVMAEEMKSSAPMGLGFQPNDPDFLVKLKREIDKNRVNGEVRKYPHSLIVAYRRGGKGKFKPETEKAEKS